MAYREVDRKVTTAPRNLTRASSKPRVHYADGGSWTEPAMPPSVGGMVEIEHVIYRCDQPKCKAMCVTTGGPPPRTCGKCKR